MKLQNPGNKKNLEPIMTSYINFDVIAKIKGSLCNVTMNTCELSPFNHKPFLK